MWGTAAAGFHVANECSSAKADIGCFGKQTFNEPLIDGPLGRRDCWAYRQHRRHPEMKLLAELVRDTGYQLRKSCASSPENARLLSISSAIACALALWFCAALR